MPINKPPCALIVNLHEFNFVTSWGVQDKLRCDYFFKRINRIQFKKYENNKT